MRWLGHVLVCTCLSVQCAHADDLTKGQVPEPGEYVRCTSGPELADYTFCVVPHAARASGSGRVEVIVLVDLDGTAADVRVVKSVPALDSLVLSCVRHWRFGPARDIGRTLAFGGGQTMTGPVRAWLRISVGLSTAGTLDFGVMGAIPKPPTKSFAVLLVGRRIARFVVEPYGEFIGFVRPNDIEGTFRQEPAGGVPADSLTGGRFEAHRIGRSDVFRAYVQYTGDRHDSFMEYWSIPHEYVSVSRCAER